MKSSAKPQAQSRQINEAFLRLLPAIARHAQFAFRDLKPEARSEAVQAVVTNAFLAYRRLCELGARRSPTPRPWPATGFTRSARAASRASRSMFAMYQAATPSGPSGFRWSDLTATTVARVSGGSSWSRTAGLGRPKPPRQGSTWPPGLIRCRGVIERSPKCWLGASAPARRPGGSGSPAAGFPSCGASWPNLGKRFTRDRPGSKRSCEGFGSR